MDQVYHEAYERLYEEAYAGESRPVYAGEEIYQSEVYREELANAHVVIREMIERADTWLSSQMGLRLRADAKLFLLTNLTEMIAKPVIGGGKIEPGELFSLMENDLQRVTSLTGERFMQTGPVESRALRAGAAEIPAHIIIDTLSRNWKEIKLMGFIWG